MLILVHSAQTKRAGLVVGKDIWLINAETKEKGETLVHIALIMMTELIMMTQCTMEMTWMGDMNAGKTFLIILN